MKKLIVLLLFIGVAVLCVKYADKCGCLNCLNIKIKPGIK